MLHLFSKASRADDAAKRFLDHKVEVIEEMKGFFNNVKSTISLKTLRELNFGKWYYNEDGTVKFKLIRLTENEAVFITELNPTNETPIAGFGLHAHDCKEKGIVVEGHLIDDLNHLKKLKNETWEYKENQMHKPYAKVKSIYEVTFTE